MPATVPSERLLTFFLFVSRTYKRKSTYLHWKSPPLLSNVSARSDYNLWDWRKHTWEQLLIKKVFLWNMKIGRSNIFSLVTWKLSELLSENPVTDNLPCYVLSVTPPGDCTVRVLFWDKKTLNYSIWLYFQVQAQCGCFILWHAYRVCYHASWSVFLGHLLYLPSLFLLSCTSILHYLKRLSV